MTLAMIAAALALFPAGAVLLSWPRQRWASRAAAGGCTLLWAVGFGFAGTKFLPAWFLVGAFFLSACFYASYVVGRNLAEYERMEATLKSRDARWKEIIEQVKKSKSRIRDIEVEQREVLALYGMLKGLSEALTWEDVSPKLDTAVRHYLDVHSFALYVVEIEAQDRLRALVRRKLEGSPGASWETLARFLQNRKLPFRVPHILSKPEAAVAVPIFENQRLLGYFYARVPDGADPTALMSKAQMFIDEITFAFRRVRLFQEVEKSAQVDGLTGVQRRGVLDRKLEEEVLRAQTFKTTFCLMLLDIDRFKSLNDQYGHPFGDQVLRRIGAILLESVYETDFVARFGGEEFAILLPRAEPAGVLRKAEALRRAVAAETFELGMQQIRSSVSIGIAHFPRDGNTADSVLRQADLALYTAKETGRNRVVDISEVHNPP